MQPIHVNREKFEAFQNELTTSPFFEEKRVQLYSLKKKVSDLVLFGTPSVKHVSDYINHMGLQSELLSRLQAKLWTDDFYGMYYQCSSAFDLGPMPSHFPSNYHLEKGGRGALLVLDHANQKRTARIAALLHETSELKAKSELAITENRELQDLILRTKEKQKRNAELLSQAEESLRLLRGKITGKERA